MAIKSNKYFGYALRNPGTCCQRWVFSELPISVPFVFMTPQGSSVPVNGTQLIGEIPEAKNGVYKFEVSMIVESEAAGRFEVDLMKDQQVIGKAIFSTVADVDGKFTGELKITTVSKMCCCDSVFTLYNRSAAAYTPVMVNNNSVQMIVTRLY